jgi:hypothetical protein
MRVYHALTALCVVGVSDQSVMILLVEGSSNVGKEED